MKEIIKDIITEDPHETEEIARGFADIIEKEAGDDGAKYFAFIAMYGDLGAGKTAFIRGLASRLTPQAYVRSPTYTLVNEYKSENFRIAHFDVYRIHDDDDLYSVGFYDYFPSVTDEIVRTKQNKMIMAVEWCENIPFALPDEYYSVSIMKISSDEPQKRRLLIEKVKNKEI